MGESQTPSRTAPLLAAAVWVALLAANLPAFLRTGPDADVVQYDLLIRCLADGGAPYRDVVENNLPGMIWAQGAVRAALGRSAEALRAVDVVVLAAACFLLARWAPGPAWAHALAAAALFVCYLSTNEWCHCQRDPWMLLPAAAALWRRRRQLGRPRDAGTGRVAAAAFAEGLVWAAAFWVKPHVILPAAAAWLWSAALAWRGGARRAVAADAAGVLAGGVVAGAAGVLWLVAVGAWPAFAEVVIGWNREYAAADVFRGTPRWQLLLSFAVRHWPWSAAYLVALPHAVSLLRRGEPAGGLLAAFALGWWVHALFGQHPFDYVLAPTLILAVALTAHLALTSAGVGRAAAVALLAVGFVGGHLPLAAERARLAGECLRPADPAELRDRLARFPRIGWAELGPVADFVRGAGVRPGELTCLDMTSNALYLSTGLPSPTRFTMPLVHMYCLPSRRELIKREVANSGTRWLVCDLRSLPDRARPADDSGELPPAWDGWRDRVAFRSGRYAVLRLDGPETRRWLTDCLGM